MDLIIRKLEGLGEAPPSPQPTDAQGRRTIEINVEAETMERQLKRGVALGVGS